MADSNNRGTQAPSKVLHIRNLPFEVSEQELQQLSNPFGKLVKTKHNVGPNKNQAFIEFSDLNGAIQMINFFAGNSEPAKVRGKVVYLQYSNRQEIVNSTNKAGNPGNVLLVSLEGLTADSAITVDVLHIVFSAFGFVAKIATFENAAGGFQALVQFEETRIAQEARESLEGHKIPDYLLPEGTFSPSLRITYSAHADLVVKTQSHRSRDYTNPYLPTASSVNDPLATFNTNNPAEGTVLLAVVEDRSYPVTVDAIHTVFSPYGTVQKIAIFEKNGHTQALVQFSDGLSAGNAKQALEGHAIYEGGHNKLKISYSIHRDLVVRAQNDKSWDFTIDNPGGSLPVPPVLRPPPLAGRGPAASPSKKAATGYSHHEVVVTGLDYERAHEEAARQARMRAGQTLYTDR